MKKILKPAKKDKKRRFGGISYINCASDTDHNKHYVYIKTVKFLTSTFALQWKWCATFACITYVQYLLHSK